MDQTIYASTVGIFTHESLAHERLGKVMGNTSKGVFLLFGKKTLFITSDTAKSPYNICIDCIDLFENIRLGEEVVFSAGEITFQKQKKIISLNNSQIWTPPLPQKIKNSVKKQNEQARKILNEIHRIIPKEELISFPADPAAANDQMINILEEGEKFRKSYFGEDLVDCLKIAEGLFGLGGGLTPAGDDLLTGFILYRTRKEKAKRKREEFTITLGARMTELAYHKTNFVSANRLEAACQGWTEELLLNAIDLIFGNIDYRIDVLAERLINFGHSTGVDTLHGISLAIGDE